MGAVYATTADVTALWRTPTTDELPTVDYLLTYASARLRSLVLDLDARLIAGTADPVIVAGVVAGAVIRAMKNPDGVKQQTAGPYSQTIDNTVAAGYVYFTPDELAAVAPAGLKQPTAKTVQFGRGSTPGFAPDPLLQLRFPDAEPVGGWPRDFGAL